MVPKRAARIFDRPDPSSLDFYDLGRRRCNTRAVQIPSPIAAKIGGAAAAIHAEVCAKGFDTASNSFVQYYGADRVDASLLQIPLLGFLPPEDPRVQGTIARVEKELLVDGLVYRYLIEDDGSDGLPGKEGAFLACSFWLCDAWALVSRRQEAKELFERLLGLTNDLGLLAEEYDPETGRQLGNFLRPSAISRW